MTTRETLARSSCLPIVPKRNRQFDRTTYFDVCLGHFFNAVRRHTVCGSNKKASLAALKNASINGVISLDIVTFNKLSYLKDYKHISVKEPTN